MCVGGKLVFGWLCGSSSISKPNQERRNWRDSFLFLVKYKKIFCALQIVRSRSRKRERIITEEKASHPSWSSAITRKYGVAPKPFLVRPHCPPLSPPFPPNPVSSRRQDLQVQYSTCSGLPLFLTTQHHHHASSSPLEIKVLSDCRIGTDRPTDNVESTSGRPRIRQQ